MDILFNSLAHDKIAKKYNLKHTEIYNDYEQNRLSKLIKKILQSIWNNTNIKVLDVWSWTWNLTNFFLQNWCNVVASDVSNKSLDLLKQKFINYIEKLDTKLIENHNLPFIDNTFDIVVIYSVLHHIPDYLYTVKEMIRVAKKWSLIFIDHEANENRYNPDSILSEYNKVVEQTKLEHIKKLFKTWELFTFSFVKTIFIKLFINKKYEREWDIHVWSDDYIEWDKIKELLKVNNCEIIEEKDYLLYIPKISVDKFEEYATKCTNTKYLIFRKK